MSSTSGASAARPPAKQIRFVNNEGQPPAKRRRINAAYVYDLLHVALFIVSYFAAPAARPGPGPGPNVHDRRKASI